MRIDKFLGYSTIVGRILGRIDDDLDKSQSSLVYNTVAPVAHEIAELGYRAWEFRRSMMIRYARGEYLTSLCEDRGYFRESAKSHRLIVRFYKGGNPSLSVPSDLKFSNGEHVFKIDEKFSSATYIVSCTLPGVVLINPDLWKCEYIDKSYTIEVVKVLQYGSDLESDDALRTRYYTTCQAPRYAGTKSYYKDLVLSYDTVIRGVRVVRHKPDWVDKNVGIYVTNNSVELLDLETTVNELCPLGHKVSIARLSVDDSIELRLEVHFRELMSQEVAKTLIDESLNLLWEALVNEIGEDENSIITSSRIITHLCNTVQGIHSIPVCLIDNSAIKTLNYDVAPVITNVSLTIGGI